MHHSQSYSALLFLAGALALGGCQDKSSTYQGNTPENKDAGYSNIEQDGGDSVPVNCTTDSQCDLSSVCRGQRCEMIAPSSTPQAAYDGFVNALKNNDLERTLRYFHPGLQTAGSEFPDKSVQFIVK